MHRSRALPFFMLVAALTACNEARNPVPEGPVVAVASASATGPAASAPAPDAASAASAAASGAPASAPAPGAGPGASAPAPEAAPPGTQGAAAAGSVAQTDAAGLKADLDAGKVPLLIDVRTPGEYEGGHVPQAVNMPIDGLEGRLAELSSHQGQPVYVICQSGGRSAKASAMLAEKGFKAVNVQGGTAAWKAAGYATK